MKEKTHFSSSGRTLVNTTASGRNNPVQNGVSGALDRDAQIRALSECRIEHPENHRSLLLTHGHIEESLRGGSAHDDVTCLHPLAHVIQLHDERDLGRSGLVTPLKAFVQDLEFGVEIAALVVSAEMVHPGGVVIGYGGKCAEH